MRRALCVLAVLMLVPALALGGSAADMEETRPYIQQILNYYLHYGEEARPEIDVLLETVAEIDPEQAEIWEKILSDWGRYSDDLMLNPGVLPDGLPEDDSLCIVVMGFCLNRDGTMQPELEGRLEVALASAEKYPNAYILCTGGPTADTGDTEAKQMQRWLMSKGIPWRRIIVEEESLSTTENAMFSQEILQKKYPQIEKLAIVTSDYHVARSCLMFSVVPAYRACYEGDRPLEVVSNAAYVIGNTGSNESRYTQAWGIAIIAGLDIESDPPALERILVETTEPEPTEEIPVETVSAPETVTVQAEPEDGNALGSVLMIAAVFTVAVTLWSIWESRREK